MHEFSYARHSSFVVRMDACTYRQTLTRQGQALHGRVRPFMRFRFLGVVGRPSVPCHCFFCGFHGFIYFHILWAESWPTPAGRATSVCTLLGWATPAWFGLALLVIGFAGLDLTCAGGDGFHRGLRVWASVSSPTGSFLHN